MYICSSLVSFEALLNLSWSILNLLRLVLDPHRASLGTILAHLGAAWASLETNLDHPPTSSWPILSLIGGPKGYRIKLGDNPLPISITQQEIQALKVVVSAQLIAENDRFRQPIQTLIEKLDNFLAERIHQAIE